MVRLTDYRKSNRSGRTNQASPHVPLKDATRRSFATRLRNEGVALNIIQALLGHSSVTITERYLSEDVSWARNVLEKAEIVTLENAKRVRNGINRPDSEGTI